MDFFGFGAENKLSSESSLSPKRSPIANFFFTVIFGEEAFFDNGRVVLADVGSCLAFETCGEGLFQGLDRNKSSPSSSCLSGSSELVKRSIDLCGCLVATVTVGDSCLVDLASVAFARAEDSGFLLTPPLQRLSSAKRSSLSGEKISAGREIGSKTGAAAFDFFDMLSVKKKSSSPTCRNGNQCTISS